MKLVVELDAKFGEVIKVLRLLWVVEQHISDFLLKSLTELKKPGFLVVAPIREERRQRSELGDVGGAGRGLAEGIQLALGGSDFVRVTKGSLQLPGEALIGDVPNHPSVGIDKRRSPGAGVPTEVRDGLAELGPVVVLVLARVIIEDQCKLGEKFLALFRGAGEGVRLSEFLRADVLWLYLGWHSHRGWGWDCGSGGWSERG
jgi:hypothetical protein